MTFDISTYVTEIVVYVIGLMIDCVCMAFDKRCFFEVWFFGDAVCSLGVVIYTTPEND